MYKQGFGLYLFLCTLLIADIAVHCVRAQPSSHHAPVVERTSELDIVNRKGVVTTRIYNGQDGAPVMMMNDQKGIPHLMITTNTSGTGLSIRDAHGNPQIQLGAGDNSAQPAEITLYSNDVPRVDMHSGLNGGYGFTALNGAGDDGVVMEYRANNDSTVALFDRHGNARASMDYRASTDSSSVAAEDASKEAELSCDANASVVSANDSSVRRAMLIYMPQVDTSMVVVNDKGKHPIWSAPLQKPAPAD